MFTRDILWRRIGGAPAWPLAWAMAAACALPWLLPDTWDGILPRGTWVAGIGLLLVFTFCAWRLRRTRAGWILRTLGLTTLLGLITLGGLSRLARWEPGLPLGLTTVEGTVTAPFRLRGESRLGVLTLSAPAALAGTELPLRLPEEGEVAPRPGTPVRVRGDLVALDAAPAFLGERPLWRARSDGRPRRLHLRSALQMEPLGPPAPSPLLRLQSWMLDRFDALPLPSVARDLWGALTLGVSPARDEVFSAFAESGTIHTLVVSGLQVTLLMGVAEALARRLFRRGSGLAAAAAGLLYAALVGFSAPVWRGLLMGLAWALGRSRGWTLPPVLTLHGALLLWLLAHPAAGADPGFLLAWAALVGLLWAAEPLEALVSPFLGRLAAPLARLSGPWFTTLPLLALLHGGAPLWGIAANALLLPLVSLLTPVCLLLTALPLPVLTPATGAVLTWIGTRLVPPFARIQPLAAAWPVLWVLLALGWLALAHRHARLRRTRALTVLLTAASLALLGFRGLGRQVDTLTVEAIDVGQGDALLVRQPQGPALLVDTGPSPWAARRIARVLSRRGVREPLRLALSHPHGDHSGGWSTLARLWPLHDPIRSEVAHPEAAWAELQSPELLATARPLLRGARPAHGEATLEARWPTVPLALPDLNMTSLVLRLRWRDREVWLMGDALAIQERDLLDLGDPAPVPGLHRLVKPGHHGGLGTCDPAWLAALRPDAAILTAGRSNTFGFPRTETLQTLRAAGCRPLVVGDSRGLRLLAQPGGWSVHDGRGRWEWVSATPVPPAPAPTPEADSRPRPRTVPGP